MIKRNNCCLWLHASDRKMYESELTDYKFFCFYGKPAFCQVIKNRSTKETIDFFDMQWNHMEFTGLARPKEPFPNASIVIPVPNCFDVMKEKVAILSEGIPFVRVDFYEVKGKPYFGEMTFYPASGFGVFVPEIWNYKLGELIKLKE